MVATGDLGARGWMAREEGVIKLVADRAREVLVGGVVVAPAGGEIMSMLALAVHAEVPIETLLHMHFAYPTYHRAHRDGAQGPRPAAVTAWRLPARHGWARVGGGVGGEAQPRSLGCRIGGELTRWCGAGGAIPAC